ncbi:MAG: hypothetical protein KIH69_020580 [Anaerolineae bacterium]|nr:hypothetical protein [Anaerolineae bacterium]
MNKTHTISALIAASILSGMLQNTAHGVTPELVTLEVTAKAGDKWQCYSGYLNTPGKPLQKGVLGNQVFGSLRPDWLWNSCKLIFTDVAVGTHPAVMVFGKAWKFEDHGDFGLYPNCVRGVTTIDTRGVIAGKVRADVTMQPINSAECNPDRDEVLRNNDKISSTSPAATPSATPTFTATVTFTAPVIVTTNAVISGAAGTVTPMPIVTATPRPIPTSAPHNSGMGNNTGDTTFKVDAAVQVDYQPLKHVSPGGSVHVAVSIKNVGTTTWEPNSYTFRGNRSWSGRWEVTKLPKAVQPGEVITFEDQFTAPQEPGEYQYGIVLRRGNIEFADNLVTAIMVGSPD